MGEDNAPAAIVAHLRKLADDIEAGHIVDVSAEQYFGYETLEYDPQTHDRIVHLLGVRPLTPSQPSSSTRQGVDVVTVQQMLGHADASTTLKMYVSPEFTQQQAAAWAAASGTDPEPVPENVVRLRKST